MKKSIALLLALTMVFALCACGQSAGTAAPAEAATADGAAPAEESPYEKVNLKISSTGTEQGMDTLADLHLAELVSEATGGLVTIEVYANGSLCGGSMPKQAELLSSGGAYDGCAASGSTLSNLSENFLVHQIPFMFSSYSDVDTYLDGTGTASYAKLAAEKNIVLLSGFYNGIRQLTTGDVQVTKPEDLKNLKIRIPSGDVYMRTLKEFGADPVAMTWSEVFTALQQGTLDGHENGYQTINSANIDEVQKYILEWNWSFDGFWFCWNADSWNKLNEATQQLLTEKCQETALWARQELMDQEAQIKQDFIAEGIVITELSGDELQAFIDVAKPAQDYFIDYYGAESCAAWGLSK